MCIRKKIPLKLHILVLVASAFVHNLLFSFRRKELRSSLTEHLIILDSLKI